MKQLIKFTLILLIGGFMFSCSKTDKVEPVQTPKQTLEISQGIKDLIYFKGDEKADTVIVSTQGGPINYLDTSGFDDVLKAVNTKNLLRISVHQSQTLKPNLFSKTDITFSQAIDYDAKSIDTLHKIVKYFKNQGRTVYVLGISFGAFMTQELITKKGLNVADKYLIMVGRLDMNESFWKGFSEGKGGRFTNGETPVISSNPDSNVINRNMFRLAAGLGRNRYTQLLGIHPDLSKITYIYGKKDQAVGKLTDAEIQFLQSKKVKVIAAPGDHSETIDNYIVQGFKEAFGIE